MAKTNPFRFSTKYQDDETDLLYYCYRYLNASTGRWLSKDPVNEPGFAMGAGDAFIEDLGSASDGNLYGFVGNNPIGQIDVLGLYNKCCCDAETIALNKKVLIARYNTAVGFLASYRPKKMREYNSWSCLNVALNIGHFMEPIPRCWTCYVEQRRQKPGLTTIFTRRHDLNAIVCESHPKSGKPGKIFFDYWHLAPPAQDYSVFVSKYGEPESVFTNFKEFDCSGPWLDCPWDFSYLWLIVTGDKSGPVVPN